MTGAEEHPEVGDLGKPRWRFLAILALVYALLLQIGLGSVVEAARAATTAGFPARVMLCQPGQSADMPAGQQQDDGRHDATCCLAGCAARLAGGPLPVAGEPLARAPLVSIMPAGLSRDAPLPGKPALHPLSARGPPREA